MHCIELYIIVLHCTPENRFPLYPTFFHHTPQTVPGSNKANINGARKYFQQRHLGDLPKKEDATYFSKDKGGCFFAPKVGVMFSKDFANFAKRK